MQQWELQWSEQRQVLSVSQLVHKVRSQLESSFRNLWVEGEISNFKRAPSGHLYFTLKDGEAQLRAVCFRMQASCLRFRPEDGVTVIARGSMSVYPPRGEFQLVVETLEPVGRGALQLAFERLKAKLDKEGLFDSSRKRKLPLLPSRIGLVTSPSGAAVQDILRVLQRRNDRIDVLIFPARVQGEGAAAEVSRGVAYLGRRPDIDVIIVARGGGSLEDLWAFNEEPVARAIATCPVPVISAVGHEVDFTIADLVADLRAPTPSAAAEIVAGVREELCRRLEGLRRRAVQSMRLILHEKRRHLHKLTSNRAFVDAESRLRYFLQRLDELENRLLRTLPERFEPWRRQLAQSQRELLYRMNDDLQRRRHRVAVGQGRLQAFSPLAVLERGYAIVSSARNEIVRDASRVAPGEAIQVRVARGSFTATRREKEDENGA